MIRVGDSICPSCGGKLRYYDHVKRIVRTKNRETQKVDIRRMKCTKCGKVHRELPDYIYPYKQYENEVIQGVLEGFITPDTIGYEDYPCEKTMEYWTKSLTSS